MKSLDKFDKVKYNNQYNKDNYKRFNISVKPEIYEDIKDTAQSLGKSVTQYIIDLHFNSKYNQ